MTDTIIVKDDENQESETVAEKVEDTATDIAETASEQANETLNIASQIATMMDSARASAESYTAQFASIAESFNHLNTKLDSALVKLDSIFELQQSDIENEGDEPAEVVVAEVKKPETEEVITAEEIEEVPEPRSKTKRRFI
jgi:hypothetical protein